MKLITMIEKVKQMLPEPVEIGCVTIYNCDCIDFLRLSDNKQYDLAICDPPYGLFRWFSKDRKSGCTLSPQEVLNIKKWDVVPNSEYFVELNRVSKNRIVWGANHFIEHLGSCYGPIIWDKGRRWNTGKSKGFPLADGEFAWSSFKKPLRICSYNETLKTAERKTLQGRWHETQKPIYLYRWLLERYAKPGQKILDTHLGSGTHAMACLELGYELVACEINKGYFDEAVIRIKEYTSSHKKIFNNLKNIELTEVRLF